MWPKAARKLWAAYVSLLLCALFLWVTSPLILDAFPVVLQVSGDESTMWVSVDGSTHGLVLAAPLRSVRFPPLGPHVREYQIDGSDTTNNFNFDPAHFAQIAGSPYYRLQSFLRDEGSYSQWRRLSVRDGTGVVVASHEDPDPKTEFSLPQPFLLTVQLHRLETPRSIEFLDEAGTVVGIAVNRNDKRIQVVETAPGDFPLERIRWYFPNDWVPPAAGIVHMVMRTLAVALGFLLLVVPVAATVPRWLVWQPGRSIRRLAPFLASAVVLGAGCYSGVVLFDRSPHILDAVSYYFQGKILASGSLAAPAPPVKEAFPTPFTVVHEGKWFSQYPPGGPLLLAAGFLLGVPWLVQPVLAAAATFLLHRIARRQYGEATALLATVLMASSPFLHLMSGSFLSHVPALFFATCFLYCTTRCMETPTRAWLWGMGLSLGGILLCREVAALLFGLPVGGYLAFAARRQGRGLRSLASGAAGLAIVALVYLLYDWALTGNPILLPRLLSYGGDRFGFGAGVGFYGQHTPAAGLVNSDELLTSLSLFLFGWPFYASLAMLLLPFLTGRSTLWDRLHGAVVGLTVLAYLGYFYHGIALGPRYYFDALPSLVLLSARGVSVLAAAASAFLEAVGRQKDMGLRARTAALLLCAMLMVPNILYFTPRQTELYQGFSGLPSGRGPALGDFVRTEVSGRTPTLDRALVTTADWWVYAVYLSAMNTPGLDGKAVFALMPEGEGREALRSAFAGRDWYRLVRDREDRLVAEMARRSP